MRKRVIILLVIGLSIVCGVFLAKRDRVADTPKSMLLYGNIEVTEVNVGFKIPGRILGRYVDEGMYVKKGDIIAKLENREIASFVMQQKAIFQEAKVRHEELKAGFRIQEIEQATANLKASEAELIKAKRDFERAEVLFNNGAIPQSKFDEIKSIYSAKSALYEKALEALSLVKEGMRKEVIEAAYLRVEQARAALSAAEERLRDTTIYAPIDGVVLKKYVEEGEIIQAGAPVVTIGDIERPWVKVHVKEEKLGLIKLNQRAFVSVDTFKNKVYEGRVTYISSEAEFTPKMVQTEEERVKLVFSVKVSIKNENGELKPGMPANVRIALH
ncbi:MAG: efflux RND transporter periplasmic adaptor subunit [Syntrophorhabdaceae bacterium]|nr:efflux RND transporter periplasmic adaptor subunit [Syntrophorhabdaceae bacterium]